MLRTKCILSPREYSDGIRISVMSRHTFNDGITPDSRIQKSLYDEWKKEFAPPLKLIGDYYKKNLPWDEFEEKYSNYLRTIQLKVQKLARIALKTDITLLCIEESPEKCHRRLLAEECKRIEPGLNLEVR